MRKIVRKGDIILVRSRGLLARIIQLGMNVERWHWFNFKPFWKKVSNHAAICIRNGVIAEATSGGIVIHSFDKAYPNTERMVISIYRYPFVEKELSKIIKVAKEYKGVYYQFINFLQYIPKILFGVWIGRTKAKSESRLYCTEFVALVINKITEGRLFKKYWRTSPSGIQNWCEREAVKIAEITNGKVLWEKTI